MVEKNSIVVLRAFAPTIFFSGLLGVLRGYFQAHKTMLQTSISQILEQIINAVVSILAAYFLIQTVWDKDSTTQVIYGAIGSALGTGAGVILALLFMVSIYMLNKNIIQKRISTDKTKDMLSYKSIFRIMFSIVTPFILSTFIYNFSTSLNQTIYTKIMIYVKNVSEVETAIQYGIYSGQPVTITGIPIAIASAVATAMIPTISGLFAKGSQKVCKEKIGQAIHTTMLVAIPSMVGLFVLAEPVTRLLFDFEESVELSASVLRVLSVTVVFYSLSTLTNGVLQGIGKVHIPVFNAAAALVIQSIVPCILMFFTNLGLYAIAIAAICYSFVMCLLNNICVGKYLGYKQDCVKTYLLPFVSSIVMGGCVYGVYYGLYFLIPVNALCLMVAIVVAVVVYFMMVIKIGGITKTDLYGLPKGEN